MDSSPSGRNSQTEVVMSVEDLSDYRSRAIAKRAIWGYFLRGGDDMMSTHPCAVHPRSYDFKVVLHW